MKRSPDEGTAGIGPALRAAVPQPPVDEVDWTALHARITAEAAPVLGRRASAVPTPTAAVPARRWWQPLAGWSPRGIPLAAAASVLLMLAAGTVAQRNGTDAGAGVGFHTVEEELVDGLSAGTRYLFADGGSSAVLEVALFADGEDW